MNENDELEERLRDLLNATRPINEPRFSDGFADRVMMRLEEDRTRRDDLGASLAHQTRRVAPWLLAASLALIAWNWTATRGTAESALAAALGLQPRATTTVGVTALEGAEAFQ